MGRVIPSRTFYMLFENFDNKLPDNVEGFYQNKLLHKKNEDLLLVFKRFTIKGRSVKTTIFLTIFQDSINIEGLACKIFSARLYAYISIVRL